MGRNGLSVARTVSHVINQRTIRSLAFGSGPGLHTGKHCEFKVLPDAPGQGIRFVRTDLRPRAEIPASVQHVVDTTLATTLGNEQGSVQTVEHLTAALYGLGIDNARVEVNGPEVPILDGSSQGFVDLIRRAGGSIAQRRPKRFLVIRKAISVGDEGGAHARLEPAPSFELETTIDFSHPMIREQTFALKFSDRAFVRELSRARTFGFARDVQKMQSQGFALGGSLNNAILIDDFSVRNEEGLRYTDEFVRHKMLDAIGDLSLFGAPLIGRYVSYKSGHRLNRELVAQALADARNYEYVEFRQRKDASHQQFELPSFDVGGLAAA